jgi:ParB family chromosome partitioning protein
MLKNLDDMIGSFEQNAESESPYRHINIDLLMPFSKHPFTLYDGERLEDMVESIKNNGVIIPIIVRKMPDTANYEILSGHNRVNAGRLAGLDEIPGIVLENISDEDALVYVIETNLMQRSFSDMKHSEKAAVIAMHQSKMFSQGKRNDILEFLKMMENETVSTSPQFGTKLRTDEKIAEMYSLSKNTVARYIRLNKLSEALKKRVDADELGFIPAVTLSYLTGEEQAMVDTYLKTDKIKIDIKKAEALRQYSNEGTLDETTLVMILENTRHKDKTVKSFPNIKIKKATLEKYFTVEESLEKIEEKIELALEFYFKNTVG